MRLTTKGRFAVTAMIDLACAETMGPGYLWRIQPASANFAVVPGTTLWQSCAATNWWTDPGPGAVYERAGWLKSPLPTSSCRWTAYRRKRALRAARKTAWAMAAA